MGNCFSGQRKGSSKSLRRLDTWTRTGMVTLRDEGLRLVPPEAVRAVASATLVDLSHNHIAALPAPMFANMHIVQRLALSSNAITVIPADIGRCSALKQLLLDSNALADLPQELSQLRHLEVLAVQGNSLTCLPAGLGQLHSLKTLNCSANQLTALPDTLRGCTALEELNAHNNVIRALPSALSHLRKLKLLQLDDNQISVLPADLLTGAESLQLISLHSNPITAEVLSATPGFDAYEARRKAKYDKAIDGKVLLSSRGTDEGIDRQLLA